MLKVIFNSSHFAAHSLEVMLSHTSQNSTYTIRAEILSPEMIGNFMAAKLSSNDPPPEGSEEDSTASPTAKPKSRTFIS